jgi:hypothetical protein
MTDPDAQPPVFLPEPGQAPAEAPPPPPQSRRHIHPDWEAVLAPDETVLWDGKAELYRQLPVGNPKLGFLLIAGAAFLAAALGDTPVPIFIGIAAFFLLQRRYRKARDTQGRNYLLTDRAAYIATANGPRLGDIRAFPITATLRLGLGRRSVAFATKFGRDGKEEAEGFLDIPDAQRVHDLIRDIQKAKA